MSEVKTYVLTVSTDEAADAVSSGEGQRLIQAIRVPGLVGVWQEPEGLYQAFLYKTPEARNNALKRVQEAGFKTAAAMLQTAYVDEKYIPKQN